jgi:hypothetical protein
MVSLAVKIQARIREVLGSNFGWHTGYPGRVFTFALIPSRQIFEIVLRFWQESFVSNPFKFAILQSSYHSTLIAFVL